MKLWSHICFLVLATSSRSGGQGTTPGSKAAGPTAKPTAVVGNENTTEFIPQSPTWGNETASTPADNLTTLYPTENKEENGIGNVTETTLTTGVTGGDWGGGSSVAVVTTDVSTATSASKSVSPTSPLKVEVSEGYLSGGYVLLVFIVLLIVGLCVVLYILRRNSRTYSFDLQRPLPLSYANEPTGTFEPVHLDDLEPPAQLDHVATDDPSPPPVGNGTTAQSEENGSNGLKPPVEQQEANGLGSGLISPPVSEQSAENPLDSATLLSSGALEEPQNENNNHPSVRSSDLFVDININEPTWSDLSLK